VPIASTEIDDPPQTETALSLLDRATDIETRFGGGFVNAIDGIEGSVVEAGRSSDWFFYVNGIESPIGSAERKVAGGDRIWWDYRDWTDAMRIPAVVGSWPEPFLQASEAEPAEIPVQCAGAPEPCEITRGALEDAGAEVGDPGKTGTRDTARILVGTWDEIKEDPAAALLTETPDGSGVFVRIAERAPSDELVALDEEAAESARLGAGAGLVAATRAGEDPPTWLVTGVDEEGVEAAANALGDEALEDHYAILVAADSDAVLPLPVPEER
jgi:hypothetical protein